MWKKGWKTMFTLRQLASVVAVTGLLSAAGAASATEVRSVAVTAIVEHQALNDVRDGVRESLKAAGFEEGRNLKWEYQSAQGNPAIAAQIARKYVGDKADVIVAIATPSAQAVVAATKTIPVVYSAVTDPVAAQLVNNWTSSGTNVTGVSDLLEVEKQIGLIKQIAPNAKRVGIVYNPGEANSVVVAKALKASLAKQNMTLVEASAPRTVDVATATKSLIGKVDVIYTNTDNNVISAYEALVKVGNDAKIPVIGSDTDSVRRGAVAALGISYYDLGRQTGDVVVRILKGEKPGGIASKTSDKLGLFLNTAAAAKQGVTLSPALLTSAKTVIK
jgi:putative ABC transport system substrate-binding protein